MNRSLDDAGSLTATCRSCSAEITYPEVERETPTVCPNCGDPGEISVIEDSTANGFDPTAYW